MLRGRKEFLEEEESSQALTTGKMLPCEEHSSGVGVQRICAGGWLEQTTCAGQRKENRWLMFKNPNSPMLLREKFLQAKIWDEGCRVYGPFRLVGGEVTG